MQMWDISTQFSKLEVDMFESFLVHFILNTFPLKYGSFKISYNTHKDKWYINKLMTMCAQEEEGIIMEIGESALLTIACGKNKTTSLKIIRRGMVKYHLLRRRQSVSFVKRKDI